VSPNRGGIMSTRSDTRYERLKKCKALAEVKVWIREADEIASKTSSTTSAVVNFTGPGEAREAAAKRQ